MKPSISNFPRHEIQYRRIESLKKNAKAARQHSAKQIAQIAKSIDKFSFIGVVIIDENSNVLCGNARLAAAEQRGMQEVPTIQFAHLTAADKRAFAIADNKLASNATWDLDVLQVELRYLSDTNFEFDFSAIGFETTEVDILLEEPSEAPGKEDWLPESSSAIQPVTARGDVWVFGESRLICGDALNDRDYDSLLGGDRARAIITDPPFNLQIDGNVAGHGAANYREFAMASGEMPSEEFAGFLLAVFVLLVRFSMDGSLHYLFMDWRHSLELLTAARKIYSEHKNTCAWVKTNAGLGSFYRSQHEFVHVFKSGKAPHVNNIELGASGRYRTNVWNYPGNNSFGKDRESLLALHPTVKPVALIADAIRDCSARGDLILDPFGGSGTTLIAAQKTGRRAAVLEIDPSYCDVVVRRWESFTGKAAVCARTGQTFRDREARLGARIAYDPPKLLAPPVRGDRNE